MDILIIEDDPVIGKAVQNALEETGYTCRWLKDGTPGLEVAKSQQHDLIVLDLLIPGVPGLLVLEKLRRDGIKTPVLVVTALASLDDRLIGFRKGADDYLVKPFAMPEMLARVDALCRRVTIKPALVLQVGDLVLDLSTRRATVSGIEIVLTPNEFSILEMLMRHAGQVVTRKMLCERLWESDWEGTNVIDDHINRLRNKLHRDSKEPLIHTVRGRGYALRATT
jgi:two-component system OmpR family response regulator